MPCAPLPVSPCPQHCLQRGSSVSKVPCFKGLSPVPGIRMTFPTHFYIPKVSTGKFLQQTFTSFLWKVSCWYSRTNIMVASQTISPLQWLCAAEMENMNASLWRGQEPVGDLGCRGFSPGVQTPQLPGGTGAAPAPPCPQSSSGPGTLRKGGRRGWPILVSTVSVMHLVQVCSAGGLSAPVFLFLLGLSIKKANRVRRETSKPFNAIYSREGGELTWRKALTNWLCELQTSRVRRASPCLPGGCRAARGAGQPGAASIAQHPAPSPQCAQCFRPFPSW